MSTKIYLIRHAEAEGNLYRRVHGHYDSNITELGLKQIDALRDRFADVPVDALYSSDLVRAQTTAQAIGVPREMETRTTPRLREVFMGRWEDTTWARLERDEAEQLAFYARDPARWEVGEPYKEKVSRIYDVVRELGEKHPEETICIVSHGCMIRTLLGTILGLSSERIGEIPHCDNTGVAYLEYDKGAFQIHYMNDGSHLTPELSTFARQSWWRDSHGKDGGNVDYFPLDLTKDADRYLAYRREAWEGVYGSLKGYAGDEAYLAQAKAHATIHPGALVEAYLRDTPIGVVELDLVRGDLLGEGAISFYYVLPEFRARGLGVQLMGHAVSVYRALGRDSLTLRVSEQNQAAISFYERLGFWKVDSPTGANGMLWEMEMDISVRVRECEWM